MEKNVNQSGVLRKRGRPAGKNRQPLSLNERRARNAQYERERRAEMADALADLAAAAGCKDSISNADLLATVITQLQQASRVKHSSDLEALRRCNKNLLAQVETLEARLAESDDTCSASVKQEEVASTSRPVKRKRDDYGHHTQDNKYTPVPECSPPEYKDTLPAYSPEQKYFPEPSPSISALEQHFVPEPKYSLETIVQDLECSVSLESKYSPKQEFEPMDLQFPVHSTTPQHYLPVPRVSPSSDSSDHQSMVPDAVDYSSYNFASAQLPTPEYQIPLESSEYIVPEQQYSHGVYCEYQPSSQCLTGPSSSEDQNSPSPYMPMVPEMCYGGINQQPAFEIPIQPNIVGSVGILPMPGTVISPDISDADILSNEDLFSVY